jgi:hypothetical protein
VRVVRMAGKGSECVVYLKEVAGPRIRVMGDGDEPAGRLLLLVETGVSDADVLFWLKQLATEMETNGAVTVDASGQKLDEEKLQ